MRAPHRTARLNDWIGEPTDCRGAVRPAPADRARQRRLRGLRYGRSALAPKACALAYRGAQAGARCRRIRGEHHPSPSITADQDERRFSRRRGAAQFPSDLIRGPSWKEERDDPSHRKPPLRKQHSLRHGNGSAQAVIGRARPAPAMGLRGERSRASA
jgi:hypothetical protein